ncbi:MAG: gliding motility-associated ABC transporter ATP-binding subunit GldA [Paludibacteraceae bacterium]|nr:gliding motility-associated ABC transporter ATP-binding subunit GldA [Paludibacteraceae bacterium]
MSITVEHLYKSYGKQLVLNDISFSIKSGEIVGFLGNNGAGKSTTMKIITGYLEADSGHVDVCGVDVAKNTLEAHRKIGYLPEHNPIYPDMYVREYLQFVAGLYKLGKGANARVDEMIERTGLTREYKKKIGMLSKGYRQRVGLAQALIPDPEVLILDEPTTGLDPNQIDEVRSLIKEVGREKTVMLSTHIMQEVSAICDRVIIINKGRIAVDDKERAVVSVQDDHHFAILAEFSAPQSVEALRKMENVLSVSESGVNTYLLQCTADERERVFRYAVEQKTSLLTLKLQEKSMEDVFRNYTKQQENGGKNTENECGETA